MKENKKKELSVEQMKEKIEAANKAKMQATGKKITDALETDQMEVVPLFADPNEVMNAILNIINNAPKTLIIQQKNKVK